MHDSLMVEEAAGAERPRRRSTGPSPARKECGRHFRSGLEDDYRPPRKGYLPWRHFVQRYLKENAGGEPAEAVRMLADELLGLN